MSYKINTEFTIEEFLWLKAVYEEFTSNYWNNPSDEDSGVFSSTHEWREERHRRTLRKLNESEASFR